MSWVCNKCGNLNKYDARPCTKCTANMPIIEKPVVKKPEVKKPVAKKVIPKKTPGRK